MTWDPTRCHRCQVAPRPAGGGLCSGCNAALDSACPVRRLEDGPGPLVVPWSLRSHGGPEPQDRICELEQATDEARRDLQEAARYALPPGARRALERALAGLHRVSGPIVSG